MDSSRHQDHVRQHVIIHGANIAHFLSLLGREADEAKRATILMLIAEEREKEKTSWDLTTGRASGGNSPPNSNSGADLGADGGSGRRTPLIGEWSSTEPEQAQVQADPAAILR